MTSKELELLARMTVELLKEKKYEFLLETWKTAISVNASEHSENAEKE